MQRTFSGLVLLLLACGSANAALLSRLSGQAYYDDVLDITWIADANLAGTATFGVLGINPGGTMTWDKATEWIAAMNTANHLGTNDWRLPTVGPVNGSSFDYSDTSDGSTDVGYNQSEQGTAYAGSTASEMAHLFHNTLDNKGFCDPLLSTAGNCNGPPLGYGLVNTGPFSNLQAGPYWSGTEFFPDTSVAFYFAFFDGSQSGAPKSSGGLYAWAVLDGDALAVVPVPGAAWLFGSALGVMGWMRRKISV